MHGGAQPMNDPTDTRIVTVKLPMPLFPCESTAVHWIVFVVVELTGTHVPLGRREPCRSRCPSRRPRT
jgi:hypothetical protein